MAVGLLCIAAGEVIGERDLLRAGALLIVLPLAAWAVVARARYRMRLDRTLSPKRVEVGSPARVVLRLENVSRLPSDTLLMEDTLPSALGGRPRFVVRKLESGGVREATYAVRSAARGQHEIGPLTVRIGDPFGCVELTRSFSSRDTLTVSPKIVPLPAITLSGDGVRGGDGRAAHAGVTGEADIATREHRHGDDLRKVHWRSTAKRGQLMVRRDEQPKQNRAMLLLDTRSSAHHGNGPTASFEWAVSACASIAVWLAHRGYATRLVTSAGAVTGGGSPTVAETAILDTLAVVRLSDERTLGAFVRSSPRETGLVIAISPIGDLDDLRYFSGTYQDTHTALVLAMDSPTWARAGPRPAAETDAARREFTALGWRFVPAVAGDALDDLWSSAGRADVRIGIE